MTVAELIEQLSRHDLNAEVLTSTDAEGNEYSPVDLVDVMYASPDWTGGRTDELVSEDWFEEDASEDEIARYPKVVALWPI